MLRQVTIASSMQRLIAALLCLAGTEASFAGPMGNAAPSERAVDGASPQNQWSGFGTGSLGYDPRANPLRGVVANDRVSMTVIQYDANANPVFVNGGGEVRVPGPRC